MLVCLTSPNIFPWEVSPSARIAFKNSMENNASCQFPFQSQVTVVSRNGGQRRISQPGSWPQLPRHSVKWPLPKLHFSLLALPPLIPGDTFQQGLLFTATTTHNNSHPLWFSICSMEALAGSPGLAGLNEVTRLPSVAGGCHPF